MGTVDRVKRLMATHNLSSQSDVILLALDTLGQVEPKQPLQAQVDELTAQMAALNERMSALENVGATHTATRAKNVTHGEIVPLDDVPSDKRLLHEWAMKKTETHKPCLVYALITASGYDIGANAAETIWMPKLLKWSN